MRKFAGIGLALAMAAAAVAVPTVVTGPANTPFTSAPFSGRIVVAGPFPKTAAFVNAAGQAVLYSERTVTVTAGAFKVSLEPTAALVPSGAYYEATYYPSVGVRWVERWNVPTSAEPVTLASVRASGTAIPAIVYPAGGDLAGAFPNPTVAGLRGRGVSSMAPIDGQALVWSAGTSSWQPGAVAGLNGASATGFDCTINAGALTCALNGTVILTNGDNWTATGNTTFTAPITAQGGAIVPPVIANSSPVAVDKSIFYVCDVAAGCTFNLPSITVGTPGFQPCFWNKAGRSGVITLQLPAATQMDKDGTLGTAAATTVSGGASGDMACVVAVTTGQYKLIPSKGTWTSN